MIKVKVKIILFSLIMNKQSSLWNVQVTAQFIPNRWSNKLNTVLT